MAIHNPSNLYSGGAVILDSRPEVNLYGQLMARQQAKNEAIDEYYRKLPFTLNSAGMRDQDIEGLHKELNTLQGEYMKNKDAIRKGTTPQALSYEQKIRAIGGAIEKSKQAAKTDLELGKMRFGKQNEYIFEDPDFMTSQQAHTLPVWDANHKGIDLGTIAIPPKPLDVDDQNKLWNAVTNGIKPSGKEYDESKQTTNPVTMLTAVPYVKKFKPEQIKGIAENIERVVKSDKSVYAHFNKLLTTLDEATINQLQAVYSSVYKGEKIQGKDGAFVIPDLMDTPEKLAKAQAILRASTPQEEGEDYRPAREAIMDKQQAFQLKKQAISESHKNNRSAAHLKVSGDGLGDYDILGYYEPEAKEVVTNIVVPGQNGTTKTIQKTELRVPVSSIDGNLKKHLGGKQPKYENGEGYYVVKEDGNWEGDNGDKIDRKIVATSYYNSINPMKDKKALPTNKTNVPTPTGNKNKGKYD